jgi:hypothetical protein
VGRGWDSLKEAISPAVPGWGETLAIVAGIIGLLWLTLRVKAWFHDDDAHADRPVDLLTDMRELHREGGLSDEEFRLIRTRLAAAVGGEAGTLRRKTGPAGVPGSDAGTPLSPGSGSATSLQGRSDSPGPEASGPTEGQR